MIAFIQGALVEKQPTRVVIDAGGVGYELFIPLTSYDRLPAAGERCRLLAYFHVREDAQQLFGFVTAEERRMFLLLIDVNGIGPKLALSALSGLSVRELKRAIVEGDVKRLSSVSGIGRKTAERMIVELKDRLSAGEALEAAAGAGPPDAADLMTRDAVMALVALGYKPDEARKAVQQALAGARRPDNVEALVRLALAK